MNAHVNHCRGLEIACEKNNPACGTGSLTCIGVVATVKINASTPWNCPKIKTARKGSKHIAFEAKLQIPQDTTRKIGNMIGICGPRTDMMQGYRNVKREE